MKFTIILALVAIFALAAQASNVVDLTSDDFDETISANEFVMVEFYAPWCGHCKKLAPDYEKLADQLKEEGSPAVIAKIDATEHAGPASTYGVRGYPTLIFFKNGNQIKYEGDRAVDAMAKFITKKSGPASLEIKSKDELDAALKQDVVVVAYLEDAEDTPFKNWMRAATSGQLEDFALAHVHDAAVAGDNAGKVIIHKTGDDDVVFDFDKITKTKLVSFITTEGYPLYEEIGQPVWQRAQNNKAKLAVVFVDNNDNEQMEIVKALAKQFKGEVSVSLAPTATQKSLAERWGASGRYFPTCVFADFSAGEAILSVFNEETEEAFTAESGTAFINAATDGTYTNYLKSEPIPENNDGPVTTLVAKNFEDIVYSTEKDVFVEFYAPWCGHCKKLNPIWDELGDSLADSDHVVIAKVDATANTLPKEINVKGYPTLIWFPAGGAGSEQVTFNGERDLESLTKFVVEKASKPVNLDKEDL